MLLPHLKRSFGVLAFVCAVILVLIVTRTGMLESSLRALTQQFASLAPSDDTPSPEAVNVSTVAVNVSTVAVSVSTGQDHDSHDVLTSSLAPAQGGSAPDPTPSLLGPLLLPEPHLLCPPRLQVLPGGAPVVPPGMIAVDKVLKVPVVRPSFELRRPRRCVPESGQCRCLVEEEGCLHASGTDEVTLTEASLRQYCASPPLAVANARVWRREDPTSVRLSLSGWIAGETAIYGPFRCGRTMCDVVPLPEPADAELQSLETTAYSDSPKPFPSFVQAVLYTESHGTHPILSSPTFAATKDVRISYTPNKTEIAVSICKYSEAQFRMPGLPFAKKTGLVAWMASHAVPAREALVAELMNYIPVDIYGRRMQNKRVEEELPQCVMKRSGREHYTESECIMYRYKFYLSLENDASDPYYHTEKFYQPLAMGTIPVYYGNRSIFHVAPSPDSFIYTGDFASIKDLADFMTRVANDEALYESYRAWKLRPFPAGFANAIAYGRPTVFCQLCDFVASRRITLQHQALHDAFTHTAVPPSQTTAGGRLRLDRVVVLDDVAGQVDLAASPARTLQNMTASLVQQNRNPSSTLNPVSPEALTAFVTAKPAAVTAWLNVDANLKLIQLTLAQLAALIAWNPISMPSDAWLALVPPPRSETTGDPSSGFCTVGRVFSEILTHALGNTSLADPPDVIVLPSDLVGNCLSAETATPLELVRCEPTACQPELHMESALLLSQPASLALLHRGPVHALDEFPLLSSQMQRSLNVYRVKKPSFP